MHQNAELQATCAALGYLEGDKYYKEPDCLESVKDLIRFLKRDNEDSCEIRRQLGDTAILQKDLIPIVKHYSDDRILLETVLRLMVNLTQPAKLCFQNHIPGDKTRRNYYLQIESQLQDCKEAFADEMLFAVFTKQLGDLLKLDWEHRQEEDRLLIERILILVRNILHIPPNVAKELRTDDDASIHDEVLWALHVSGMEDLLLYIASSDDERQFAFHVLEIISLMFREQNAEQLASAGTTRAVSEKERDERELAAAVENEKLQRRAAVMKYSSRHSNFGGTFVVANMKSISENNLIYHRPVSTSNEIHFDRNKVPRKKPKNRKPIIDPDIVRRSTLSIRLFLKDFCIQFLENCYNPLMRAVKDSLLRSKAQDNDETYYLWSLKFFMEFNRIHQFRIELVSETLSIGALHYISTQMETFHEMMISNKKEAVVWSRRIHLALKAYNEQLLCLLEMDKCADHAIRESSRVIKSNVFYTMEYRDIFLVLLKKFDETKQSRTFLRDLIESTHLFLKMLDHFCKKNTHLVVQKKKKRVRKKKKPSRKQEAQVNMEAAWDEVSGDLSAILQGRGEIPTEILPFDAASDVDMDQQRVDAVFRIQDSLRQNKAGEAVALFRSAREVWPDREEFGRPDISPEDEFMALREICFTELPNSARTAQEEMANSSSENDDGADDEEMEAQYDSVEQEFSFKEFILRFAHPLVIKPYVTLLTEYAKNSVEANHAIIKMLHRIGFDCHLVSLLFQASLFRIFQRVLSDPLSKSKQNEELRRFAIYVVQKFFETAQTNSKVFMELFFWKGTKDAYEITEGYGSMQLKSKTKQNWTEEQDDELRHLFNEYRDNPEGDVVDLIMTRLIDQSKTRRQVLRQLVQLDLIGSAKDIKKRNDQAAAARRPWTEDQEDELRRLFEQFREAQDVVGTIISNLEVPRSKQKVIEKILELGLVSDKKELYKKRSKKQKEGTNNDGSESESGNSENGENYQESSSDYDMDRPLFLPQNDERSELQDAPVAPRKKSPKKKKDEQSSRSKQKNNASISRQKKIDDKITKPNDAKIKKQVANVVGKGLATALAWLRNCLLRTATDREEDEDDDQAIPIVPITEEQDDAMSDEEFQSLLQACGLNKPANEQERFWRIPGHSSPADLRKKVELLQETSTPEVDDEGEGTTRATSSPVRRDSSSSESDTNKDVEDVEDDYINSKLRKNKALEALAQKRRHEAVGKKRKKRVIDSNDDELNDGASVERSNPQNNESDKENETIENEGESSKKDRHSLKRVIASDTDESDDDDQRLMIDENPKSNKKIHLMDSEDERSVEKASGEVEEGSEEVPQTGESQSESVLNLNTFPATMFSQPVSDSELDDHVPLITRTKKHKAIESDSEDDQ